MCGIVGVAGTGPASPQMKEFFQTLLLHDVIRGHHATGVAAIDTLNRDLCVEKKAVASPVFLEDKEAMDNLFAYKHNFNIYIGHNRWATSGAKDADENAHPFIHGDIVGVHNGSLRNQSLLDDHGKFKVDSDNLFYHLNKHGLDDTIQKTNGAFALVWYDRTDNSLNFLRNDERPLAIGKLSNGYWVWASEMGMLRWLVKRHKNLSFETKTEKTETGDIKYDTLFNLEKGQHMKLIYKDKTRQFDGDPVFVKKEFPSFPYETRDYYGGYGKGWQDSRRSTSVSRGNSTPTGSYYARVQENLDKFIIGGKVGDTVLEVEYLRPAKEKTSTGFEANMALFLFRNKDGQEVICHAFLHNGVKFLHEWTEETHKGTKVYGTICTVTALEQSTYNVTKNEELGFSLSLNMLTASPPKHYYAFGEAPGPKAKTKAKGGATTGQNVVPFPGNRELRPAHEEATAKAGSEEYSKSSAVEGVDSDDFMNGQIILANGVCSRRKFIQLMEENGPMCSNCGNKITGMPVGRLYRTMWFDRSEGLTQNYLSCSRKCYNLTEAVMEQLDSDYDKQYGGRDD